MTANIDPAKFNKCKWNEKVSRSKLIRLYQNDAKMLIDEDLLDDVGYTFYARCKQARDTRECLDKDEKEKMLLIDWLVHECHVSVMTGGQGRSVCVNLIEGTITQIRNMLEMLAGN